MIATEIEPGIFKAGPFSYKLLDDDRVQLLNFRGEPMNIFRLISFAGMDSPYQAEIYGDPTTE